MSEPTGAFSQLSITKMPTTRSQVKRDNQRSGSAVPSDSSSSVESDKGTSSALAPVPLTRIQGHSGITYDIQRLSPNAISRATLGLRSEYMVVDKSRTVDSGSGSYHAIQLDKPISIRIFDPEDGNLRVECTCDDHQNNKSICVHIYWLYDGLNAALAGSSASSIYTVTKDDVIEKITGMYELIGKHLGSLHNLLNEGPYEDWGADFEESGTTGRDPVGDRSETIQDVQDMLSIFDLKSLPDEFGDEMLEEVPRGAKTFPDLIIPGNMPATMFGLALRYKGLRDCFQKIFTREYCAMQVYAKLERRTAEVFERLDYYTEIGPRFNPRIVARCAIRLRQIVQQLVDYNNERAPFKPGTMSRAAEILLEMLIRICDRDGDIYENISWDKTEPDPVDEQDRNLYYNLIANPASTGQLPNETQFFFIDAFGSFPPSERQHLIERLEETLETIKENGAPDLFVQKFEDLIEESQEQFDPTAVQPRRNPSSGESASQRRRLR